MKKEDGHIQRVILNYAWKFSFVHEKKVQSAVPRAELNYRSYPRITSLADLCIVARVRRRISKDICYWYFLPFSQTRLLVTVQKGGRAGVLTSEAHLARTGLAR